MRGCLWPTPTNPTTSIGSTTREHDRRPCALVRLWILRPYLAKALATKHSGVNVFLHGPPGTGKTQLVSLLVHP